MAVLGAILCNLSEDGIFNVRGDVDRAILGGRTLEPIRKALAVLSGFGLLEHDEGVVRGDVEVDV